jgi:hypothetical protein
MKVWAVGVVVFFGLAELYQWLHSLSLPLPVYGVAGLVLALASNGERWSSWLLPLSDRSTQFPAGQVQSGLYPPITQVSSPPNQTIEATDQPVNQPVGQPSSSTVDLPSIQRSAQPLSDLAERSISFTIRKPQP